MSDSLIQHELSHKECHGISLALLNFLSENDIQTEVAVAALGMSLARIVAPKTLEPEEEVQFIHELSQFLSLYFMTGVQN